MLPEPYNYARIDVPTPSSPSPKPRNAPTPSRRPPPLLLSRLVNTGRHDAVLTAARVCAEALGSGAEPLGRLAISGTLTQLCPDTGAPR